MLRFVSRGLGPLVLAFLTVWAGGPAGAQEQPFTERCKDWIAKKGYSADYIEHKTGQRQPGLPNRWKANVKTEDVQAGDVVFAGVADSPSGQRVAYVEEVEKAADGSVSAVFVTEWNQGRSYRDRECLVTNLFGQTGSKLRVPLNTVLRVWRPSLPLQ